MRKFKSANGGQLSSETRTKARGVHRHGEEFQVSRNGERVTVKTSASTASVMDAAMNKYGRALQRLADR